MAAVPGKDLARVWVQAWLEDAFKATLERDPAKAVKEFNNRFGIENYATFDRVFDLKSYIYDEFKDTADHELDEIIEKGTLRTQRVVMKQNQWILVEEPN